MIDHDIELCDCEACQEADGQPDVMAIHRIQQIAILDNLTVVPVTHWFNRRGDECESKDAVVCVCGADEVGWYTIDLVNFDYIQHH